MAAPRLRVSWFALLLHTTCGLTAVRWAVPQPRAPPRAAVRASEEELDRFFFDRAEVFVRGGAGGAGAVATQGTGKRPAGGNGGEGGSVYIECSAETNTLGHLHGRAHVRAYSGFDAKGRSDGPCGADEVVLVPPHTLVIDRETNATLGQLTHPGERLLVAAGGTGGEGNGAKWRRTGLDNKKVGPPGGAQKQSLILSMELVADVGLVGYPNAGKSTLLTAVTRATPKVADYPFTTLVPNLGVCEGRNFGLPRSMVWLDIPGLIDGAHAGKGLGRAFLRHTERCRLLLHLVNGESESAAADFVAINRELRLYSPKLGRTPQVVVLTKADLPHVAAKAEETLAALRAVVPHKRILCISAQDGANLKMLVQRTRALLDQMDSKEAAQGAAPAGGGGGGEGSVSGMTESSVESLS
eukprot:Transcript_4549.p1 GENE.Transcript_4549~~Transcript_4549.p1  ORF type:complete len:412 (-),score=126.04 Transcript_4549:19-1254(-)